MKISLAGVLAGFQSLAADDSREKPVDRLGAIGAMQIARAKQAERQSILCGLGKDLIAFKFSNRASAKADAEDALSAILGWKDGKGRPTWRVTLTGKQRNLVASQAVMEFCVDFCPTCRGAAEIPNHSEVEGAQPMKACPSCDNTGRRRYSDDERKEAMGEALPNAMMAAHQILVTAEGMAVAQVKEMLERWK